MQARSALFDLYGDHLRPRGGRAAVAALVRLLAPLGIAAPAVRTAVSRMVRQDWLQPLRLPTGPGYGITPKAARRLDAAGARIYRTQKGQTAWNGQFDLIMLEPPQHRGARAKLVANLGFLGYGTIDGATWISPRPGEGVDGLLQEAGVRYDRIRAAHAGGTAGALKMVERAWDLDGIAAAYGEFVERLGPLVGSVGPGTTDEQAYAVRFMLVHAWRAFLFKDPQLPVDLLPERWAGNAAAVFFDRHAGRLRPAADRYVEGCLSV